MVAKFSDLLNKTLIEISGLEASSDEVIFKTIENEQYKMLHYSDCCEQVSIEDISGDISDLLNSPIIQAEESTSDENPIDISPKEYQDSYTWTFYRIATAKGLVVIRWYGESNGYYSESVDFEKLVGKE